MNIKTVYNTIAIVSLIITINSAFISGMEQHYGPDHKELQYLTLHYPSDSLDGRIEHAVYRPVYTQFIVSTTKENWIITGAQHSTFEVELINLETKTVQYCHIKNGLNRDPIYALDLLLNKSRNKRIIAQGVKGSIKVLKPIEEQLGSNKNYTHFDLHQTIQFENEEIILAISSHSQYIKAISSLGILYIFNKNEDHTFGERTEIRYLIPQENIENYAITLSLAKIYDADTDKQHYVVAVLSDKSMLMHDLKSKKTEIITNDSASPSKEISEIASLCENGSITIAAAELCDCYKNDYYNDNGLVNCALNPPDPCPDHAKPIKAPCHIYLWTLTPEFTINTYKKIELPEDTNNFLLLPKKHLMITKRQYVKNSNFSHAFFITQNHGNNSSVSKTIFELDYCDAYWTLVYTGNSSFYAITRVQQGDHRNIQHSQGTRFTEKQEKDRQQREQQEQQKKRKQLFITASECTIALIFGSIALYKYLSSTR